MRSKDLRDWYGMPLRALAPAPADLAIPASMWDLLSAIERAEHEQIIRDYAQALASAQPKPKRPIG